MDAVKYILPLFLIVGAVYLIIIEIKAFPRLKRYGHPVKSLKFRMARRITGSILVIAIALLIFWGLNYLPKPTAGLFQRQAAHWAVVMGLVFIVVLLALWDTIDGLKYLENLANQVSKEELDLLSRIASHQEQKDLKH